MAELYRRRVGNARPSHLMFTSGVGSLVDLPNFSVLVSGLDSWSYDALPDPAPIAEPRLLSAVQHFLNPSVKQLRPAPWMAGMLQHGTTEDPALRVGVPVVPFPGWLRCTACQVLDSVESGVFRFENINQHRPHDAHFSHTNCTRKKGRRPLAVSARFVLVCQGGHLDDFPYPEFVHRGVACEKAQQPQLRMDDRGGNLGANVAIACISCGERRNIREAIGRRNEQNIPACRGRHPHLATFDPEPCGKPLKVLVVGASNQWFAQTMSALAVPPTGASELAAKVLQQWEELSKIESQAEVPISRKFSPVLQQQFVKWTDDELWEAIQQHRTTLDGSGSAPNEYPDLRTPEWEIFSAASPPDASDDFALRRETDGVPAALTTVYSDVAQVERLREVRALIGFTRLDAPDRDDPTLVTRAPLARDIPSWVPASEVRGEGIFVRVPENLLSDWEQQVDGSDALRCHREAYARFNNNRHSDRITKGLFDPMRGWPGSRYIALHTLSHLLLRTIALECGYNGASLSERVYSSTSDDDPRGGILIYTSVPDAEGTLGGLVSLAEPASLVRLTRRALSDARHCSSDPLCAERLPHAPSDFLHGAACHVCLFVSETSCDRGNRFLDRRFVVPIDDPKLALFPDPV
jgi:hypothetical protein